MELREEIDKMNLWLFDNINNAVYRSSFSRSNEGHFDGVNTFFADFAVPLADAKGRIEGEEDGFRASTHYDLALPKIDWDAQWKVSTERAYLSSDPTHPIYLGNNRRFDIDPTWYDLGAESPKKRRKKRRRPADAAAADQIIDKK